MNESKLKIDFLEDGVKIEGCASIPELWAARDAIENLVASLLYEKGYFEEKEKGEN